MPSFQEMQDAARIQPPAPPPPVPSSRGMPPKQAVPVEPPRKGMPAAQSAVRG